MCDFGLRSVSNFNARQDLEYSALLVLFVPRPAVVLMTGRGVFGLRLSNRGRLFCRERGSAQILVGFAVSHMRTLGECFVFVQTGLSSEVFVSQL